MANIIVIDKRHSAQPTTEQPTTEQPRRSAAELALDKRAELAGLATKQAVKDAYNFVSSNIGTGANTVAKGAVTAGSAVIDVVGGFFRGLTK